MPVDLRTPAVDADWHAPEEAVAALARAMKNVSFYDVTHPVVADVLKEVASDFDELLEERPEFVIKFSNGYVVVQDRPVLNQHASIGNLVGACRRREVETIIFRRGLDEEELAQLVDVLAADPAELKAAGGMREALVSRNVSRIVVDKLVSGAEDQGAEEDVCEWRWVYTTALDVLRGAAGKVRTGRPIDVTSVQSSVRGIVDDVIGDRSIVYNLSWMKGMDEYTFVHALHICILAIELGRELGLTREHLEELGTATLLHDVGKIFVPLEILRKPAKLDDREFAVMSRHPVDGALVLGPARGLPPVAAVVAFEHHMHLDHSGYPKMRRARALNMYSLMTSVVDVYDALTTMRPYRPPLPPRAALEVMREQYEGRLEPRLLRHFLHMLGPYPWGTMLRLPDDRLVVITRPNPTAPDNPLARVVEAGNGGARVLEEELPLHDLTTGLDGIEVVDPVSLGIDLTALLHRPPPSEASEEASQ